MPQPRTSPINQKIATRREQRVRYRKVVSIERKNVSDMPEDLCPEAIAAQLNTYCAMFEYFGWHAPQALLVAARDELLKLSCNKPENNAANAP